MRPSDVTSRLAETFRRAMEWIGRRPAPVLVALLIASLAAWGFVELADNVMEGDTQKFDEWAVRALRRADDPAVPLGPRWLHEVGRDFTALGGIAVLALTTAAVTGYLLLRRQYREAIFLLAAVGGGLGVVSILKLLFARDRPSIVPHLAMVMTHSFPSGHSMLSAVVYLTLGTLLARIVPQAGLKAYFLVVAIILAVLVGVSRVYLGVHYPTDVLAGWTAGLAWALVVWAAARKLGWLEIRAAEARSLEA